MNHFFQAITNTSGDSLVGYFARVIDPATQNTVTLSSDNNGTPIVVVSGVDNMAVTDDYGNISLYVEAGTYHLDIYAPNATSFVFRVPNVAMTAERGPTGPPGPAGAPVTVSVATFGAVGGDFSKDHPALLEAIAVVGAKGGRIFFPATDLPYRIDAFTLQASSGTTFPIELVGEGKGSKIMVNSPCNEFITCVSGWLAITDLTITDFNNYCSNEIISRRPIVDQNFNSTMFSGLQIFGSGANSTAWALANHGGYQYNFDNIYVQNTLGAFLNASGGVDSTCNNLYALGVTYGGRWDSNLTFGHAENFKATGWTVLATRANAVAYEFLDVLDCKFVNCTGVQLGLNGIGCWFHGSETKGNILVDMVNCFFEGAQNGYALRADGINARIRMIGGGFGQGGWSPSVINPVKLSNAFQFDFIAVDAFFPNGNCNKVAEFNSCADIRVDVSCSNWDQSNNPPTDDDSTVIWGLRRGYPVVRRTISEFPRAVWTQIDPLFTQAGGTLPVLTQRAAWVRREGRTVTFKVYVRFGAGGVMGTGKSIEVKLPFLALGETVGNWTAVDSGHDKLVNCVIPYNAGNPTPQMSFYYIDGVGGSSYPGVTDFIMGVTITYQASNEQAQYVGQ